MTEYSWKIEQLVCVKSLDGLTDVVREVRWFRIASAGLYAVSSSGSSTMTPPDPSAFVPFAQLTENDVKSWLDSTVDVTEIDAELSARLATITLPPQEVVVDPPWVQGATSPSLGTNEE